MKRHSFAVIATFYFLFIQAADKKEVFSPDKKIQVIVEAKDKLYYSIIYENKPTLFPSVINMTLQNGENVSGKISFRKVTNRHNKSVIISPVPEKRKNIPDDLYYYWNEFFLFKIKRSHAFN